MAEHDPNERFGLGRWHVDDFLSNVGTMNCVRRFLEFKRAPAVSQRGNAPPLFATVSHDMMGAEYLGYWKGNEPAMRPVPLPKGTRVRVVMASRFGDVGITPTLEREHGYVLRCFLPELHDFSDQAGTEGAAAR